MNENKFYMAVHDLKLVIKDENGEKHILNYPFVKDNLLEEAKFYQWKVEDIIEYCIKYGKADAKSMYSRLYNERFAKSPEEALKMTLFSDTYDCETGKLIRNTDYYKAEKVEEAFNSLKYENGTYTFTEFCTIEGMNKLKPCQIEKYNKNEFHAFEIYHEIQIFETVLITEKIN